MIARQSYLLCATPRTGSTLLAEMLCNNGFLGMPREYFEYLKGTGLPRQPIQYFTSCDEGEALEPLAEQLGLPPLRKNLRRIVEYKRYGYRRHLGWILRQGTTGNGIFGAKIMWGHLHDFLDLLTGSGALVPSRRIDTCLRSIFPNLKYIYIARENKLRQAVSLWVALQTQQWRLDANTHAAKVERVPTFHFEAVDFLRRRLVEQDLAWRRFFAAAEIAPLMLTYEQFASNLSDTLMQVVDFMGVKGIAYNCFVQPSLVQQADSKSEDFLTMYEAAAASLPA